MTRKFVHLMPGDTLKVTFELWEGYVEAGHPRIVDSYITVNTQNDKETELNFTLNHSVFAEERLTHEPR